jgi:hypothetical protein
MNQLEKDTEIEGNNNNLLEEKIKVEVENALNSAEEGEGGKKRNLEIKNKRKNLKLKNQK